jgi:hypothetical protein
VQTAQSAERYREVRDHMTDCPHVWSPSEQFSIKFSTAAQNSAGQVMNYIDLVTNNPSHERIAIPHKMQIPLLFPARIWDVSI